MDRTPLPSSFDDHPEFQEETSLQKFRRRLREEPLIPLGCAATCYALYRAYCSMKAGDSVELNRMFRARIYAQGFTLVAVVAGGMYYKTERQQRREFDQAVALRKSQEKRDAWLRELEIRDMEDQDWRERHAAMEAAAKEAKAKATVRPSADASPAEAPAPPGALGEGKRVVPGEATNEANGKAAEQEKVGAGLEVAANEAKETKAVEQEKARASLELGDMKGRIGVLDAVRGLVWR